MYPQLMAYLINSSLGFFINSKGFINYDPIYMKELGMGNDKYKLIDVDNEDKEISQTDAVIHIKPFKY